MKIDRAEDHSLRNRLRSIEGGRQANVGTETASPVDVQADALFDRYVREEDRSKQMQAKETFDAYVLLHKDQLSPDTRKKYEQIFDRAA